jgi:hypothetical protein
MNKNQIRKLKGKLNTHRDLPEPNTNIVDEEEPTTTTTTTQQIVEHIFSKALASRQGMEKKVKEAVKGKEEDRWVSGMVQQITNFPDALVDPNDTDSDDESYNLNVTL